MLIHKVIIVHVFYVEVGLYIFKIADLKHYLAEFAFVLTQYHVIF